MSQIIANLAIGSGVIALVGLSFALIYQTTRFFHFAHGIVLTSGAYFTFLFKSWLGLPLTIACLGAVSLSSLLGCLMELAIYRPLRRKDASPLILLIASLGTYILLQNLVSVVFGDQTQTLSSSIVEEGIDFWGARVTQIQLLTVSVSLALVIVLAILLKQTKIGKAMRAVANDPELASVSGIDSDRVILWTFAMGSALAGVAGILIALDVDMTPTMGMNALINGVVAVLVGGMGSIPGVLLGALLLSASQQLGVWFIGSQWQDAISFMLLLLFFLLRPQGFLGKKLRKATV